MKKTAVVLFNLGGPDQLSSVKPFLFSLFNDKAIISLPQPFRFLLAKLISHKRASKAENIYKQIGNKSPIVDITNAQAESLAKELSFYGDYEVFVIMRYWHPLASDVVDKIKQYQPDNLVLLPLYPQFSSTTTASSFKDFLANFSADQCNIKTVCCYPTEPYFIKSHSHLILAVLQKINNADLHKVRILFSAHGLPQKVIDRGDPYVYQVTKTVEQVVLHLQNMGYNNLDYSICYQSKVGPLKWTNPSLESEMRRLALDGKIAVVSPIAFVSDHSETLVELDIEYKQMAKELGISDYHRVSSLNLHSEFIKSLADLVINACNSNCQMFCGTSPTRICPKNFKLCPNHNSK